MAEYIDRTQIKWYGCDFEGGKACCKNQGDCSKCIHGNCDHDEVMNIPLANVIERKKIDKAIEEIETIIKQWEHRVEIREKNSCWHDETNNYIALSNQLIGMEKILEILKRNIGE